MKSVDVVFQFPRYLSPKQVKIIIAVMIFLVLVMTGFNLTGFISNRRHIGMLEDKVTRKKQAAGQRLPGASSATDGGMERMDAIKAAYMEMAPLLRKDMFNIPLLLDDIEKALPDAVVISSLTLKGGRSSLILKGSAPDADTVSAFLTALKNSRPFIIDFNRGSVVGGNQFYFEIKAHETDGEIK